MSKILKFLIIFLLLVCLVGSWLYYEKKVVERQTRQLKWAPKPEKNIRVIEGWNVKDINQYLEQQGLSKNNDFINLVGWPKIDYRQNVKLPDILDYSQQFDFLADKPKYYGLEGYLFPDTYRVYEDASTTDIVLKMLNNFSNKLTPDLRAEIKRQGKSINEIIIMASIIEKEVKTEADMKIVSGIFWNRIKIHQALESCATLAYALGIKKPQYTIEETKTSSAFNTYRNPGLPPAPIANPGLNAIKAAIYPTDTNYNYFLSRPDTGETIFSATFAEHIKNKNKYLK